MDKTKNYCARDDHECHCVDGICDQWDLRDEIENLVDGRLDAAIHAYETATSDTSRQKKYLKDCPDTTIANGIITLAGCNGTMWQQGERKIQKEGAEFDSYYSCVAYNEIAKVVYNTCGNPSPNLFWSESPGSFGICARHLETNDCSGGELHVSMYMGQIKADGDQVLEWYKKASFAIESDECGANQKGGFRWRNSFGTDPYQEKCNLGGGYTQMEFEEPINWFTATNASTTYSESAHLGVGWSMMQIRFAEHPTDNTISNSLNKGNGMCAFSDTVGNSGITECQDNVIHPGGAKFLLELDQNTVGASYPHTSTNYWDDCIATGTQQCLQCFVVDYSAKGEGMEVTADMESKSISATSTKDGVETTFRYSFEDIVNTVRPAGDFEPSNPDFVYDFKRAKVILEEDGDITRAYVCLDKTVYDPTNGAGQSFQCPSHSGADAKCETVFFYDPEMSVTIGGGTSGATGVAASSVVLAALAFQFLL